MPKAFGRMHMEIIDLTQDDTPAERHIGWTGHRQRPTPPQKREAKKPGKAEDPQSDDDQKHSCIICMDDIKRGRETFTQCMHGPFHLQCIERWKEIKQKCPLCNSYIGDSNIPRKRRRIASLEDALSGPIFIPMD